MNEDVQDFVSDNVERRNWLRSEEAFVPNGSKNPAFNKLYQRHNRDISEKGINEDVQDFANKNVDRLPWPRSEEAFVPNGSKVTFPPAPAALYQRQRNGKDISEKNIDAEVHGLANSMVDRINWNRSKEPFIPNGSEVTFPAAPSLYQQNKADIANKEVRPDVWVTVHKMIDPVAHWRGNKAPKSKFEPWWGEDGEPPMQELEKPKCPEELEEEPNPMKKKLEKQAKKAKAKKKKQDEEMPGDIEEKKDEKKDDKKDEKKEDDKDDAKDEKKEEKKDEKLAQKS